MKKRSDTYLLSLLVVAILVVSTNAWFAFRAESILATSEAWVAHSWQAIDTIEHTLNAVEAMETGARGPRLGAPGTWPYCDVRVAAA
jgi:hypothetical protein